MSPLLAALQRQAETRPSAPALIDGSSTLSYGALFERIATVAAVLFAERGTRCGLMLDNGIGWAAIDLAAGLAGTVLVPIPGFFSDRQLAHVIAVSGIELLITDDPARIERVEAPAIAERIAITETIGQRATCLRFDRTDAGAAARLPGATRKITFTSGTTGTPKGVCLSDAATDRVAASLLTASLGSPDDRHLCLLPLATLLENIAGIEVPVLAGAATTLLPLRQVGLIGSSSLDPFAMLAAIEKYAATTIVTVPQALAGLLMAIARNGRRPASLRLVAVGGAPLAASVLKQAEALGLPVYQGYGLSELASVAAFNGPAANKPGSVGRLLPHAELAFAADGEILLRGAVFEGYLGEDPMPRRADRFWPTGDLGHLDADGYLHLDGRKKNMFITAFGRNVSPEWIECELTAEPSIAQAAVFGEARPRNAAIIVPRGLPEAATITADIGKANERLPDYARVHRWLIAENAFSPANGMATANGRLRRDAILETYRTRLDRLYEEETADVL
ncbi:MAG TPA: AMP-binding protein [Candidatus Cybelea sp.]|nr:AMP-binding protein [Candidatus Cybelea sp.]